MSARYTPYQDARVKPTAPVTRAFILGIGLSFVGVGILALVAVLTLYPIVLKAVLPPPIVFQNLPWAIANDPVPMGQPVVLRVSLCNTTDEPVVLTTSRTLVNEDSGEQLSLPSQVSAVQPGCLVHTSVSQQLPELVPLGRYHIEGIALAQSRYQATYASWQSQPFLVIPGPSLPSPPEFRVAPCSGYASQAEAQAAYRADPEGLAVLDGDLDGYACEANRPPFDTTPVAKVVP